MFPLIFFNRKGCKVRAEGAKGDFIPFSGLTAARFPLDPFSPFPYNPVWEFCA